MASSSSTSRPPCRNLVLDAGPLLSLSPLRGLSETFYTVPQVLDELRDKRAREHFEKLGSHAGVRIQVQGPGPQALAHVIQFAKKTGDYSVLSTADLCVLALTYELEQREREAGKSVEENQEAPKVDAPEAKELTSTQAVSPATESALEEEQQDSEAEGPLPSDDSGSDDYENPEEDEQEQESLDIKHEHINNTVEAVDLLSQTPQPPATSEIISEKSDNPLYDDPSDEDDSEGEWITPTNVALHKSRALQLIPGDNVKAAKRGTVGQVKSGCMTADFAMQNVLLQMGLSLVGVEGKKIERVKTWVLRCHACFKICKDSSRKFCPSCGNPTLLRASVTLSSPNANASTPTLQVHLKKNFQFKTRGTKYSIPAPKAGSAKTGSGESLVLREDQTAWVRAKKIADGKREKEEKRIFNGSANSKDGSGVAVGSWMDPDWVPEMLSVGAGGKGRSIKHSGMDGDMPVIGHGRKNPNERRRRK